MEMIWECWPLYSDYLDSDYYAFATYEARKGRSIVNLLFRFPSSSWGFPQSSVGKESACNEGDPSLIHRSGRFGGEGIGYPLQYSWASLLVQLVKNPPAIQKTWVWSLGWEDPLKKGKATHSSILAWRIPRWSQRVRQGWATFTFFQLQTWKVICLYVF